MHPPKIAYFFGIVQVFFNAAIVIIQTKLFLSQLIEKAEKYDWTANLLAPLHRPL